MSRVWCPHCGGDWSVGERESMMYYKERAEKAESELGRRPKHTVKVVREILGLTQDGLERGEYWWHDTLVDIALKADEFLRDVRRKK